MADKNLTSMLIYANLISEPILHKEDTMTTFQEIWNVFSTGKGTVHGLDAISLSAVFRIAETELRGDAREAQSMREGFLEHEPRTIGHPISSDLLDGLVQEIKNQTRFNGTVVLNADGQRRYENLADVGFMITNHGFKTVVLSSNGIQMA
jgi:hypothetical protein